MNYAEIFTALEPRSNSTVFELLPEPFAAQTALSMLPSIVRLPLMLIHYPRGGFSMAFSKETIPEIAAPMFGRNLRRYRVWRNLILDCEMLVAPGQVDTDPWDSVRRLARLLLGKPHASGLYHLSAGCPDVVPPWALDRVIASSIDEGLTSSERNSFRNALRVLDLLRDHEIARRSELLPIESIGRLQRPGAHTTHAPLPTRLEEETAGSRELHRWVSAIWRVGMRSGVLRSTDNPGVQDMIRPATYRALRGLDPKDVGITSPGRAAFKGYVRRLAMAVDPDGAWKHSEQADLVEASWRRLRRSAIDCGVSASRADLLTRISRVAKSEGLSPADMSPRWFLDFLSGLVAEDLGLARRACYLLDDLRDTPGFPGDLLPPEPTGVVRLAKLEQQKQTEKAATGARLGVSQKGPIEQAWVNLFAGARQAGIDEDRLHPLYALKRAALHHDLLPQDLDRRAVVGFFGSATGSEASKIRMSAKLLDDLRCIAGLADVLPGEAIGRIADRRRSAGEVASGISEELEKHLCFQGGSDSTKRGIRIAVRALAEVAEMNGYKVTCLDDLLAFESGVRHWGKHEGQKSRYSMSIRNLRAFRSLGWTDGWRSLQTAIVADGILPRDNPLPAVLKHAAGLEPEQLTTAWARKIDRSLRRPSDLSRHGRADLARTFAANLARFDLLHGRSALRETGLLPPKIGTIRRAA